ncbi:MAG TPA: complex I subunit 5 family protein [Isosphaeraceae bacterium]|nr:complex I subunit 5 family protein [Isosphaeraceae bacterium]
MESLAPLPVAIPLLAAAVLVGAGPILPRWARDTAAIATAAAVAAIAAVLTARSEAGPLVYWFGGWRPRGEIAVGISFAIDPLGAGLATLVASLVAAALAFSWRYFKEVGALYHGLMLVFLAAMAGFCLTGDLFNMFVFFELMSVAAYALTGYKSEEVESLEGALNFAIVNSVGAFLVLIGIALLYGRTGALNLAQIGRALAIGPPDGLVVAAFALIASGFLVKGAAVPFHFWLADAHAVAPTPVCVLFSGVMVELGLYAVARVYWTIFSGPIHPGSGAVHGVLLAVGTASALLGAVMCLLQRHLKRLLAFSTISHGGTIAIGIALLRPSGLAGAAIYVLGHGLVKGGLFLGAGIVLHRLRSVDTIDLHGKGRRLPYTGVLLALGGLGLAGLPPFGTWLGKTLIEEEAHRLGLSWIAPVLVLSSALTGAAVLRATGRIFLGLGPAPSENSSGPKGDEGGETAHGHGHTPMFMLGPAALLVLGSLLTGLVPGLGSRTHSAAVRFQDRDGYAAAVFGKPPAARPAAGPASPQVPVAPGLVSGLGAVVLALLLLFEHRLPEPSRRVLERPLRRATVPLRHLHSGHVGDYVAWLVLGVAAIGAALTALVR